MADTFNKFLSNFKETWQAGKDARLYLECHAGQVWMNLHLRLTLPPPPKHQHHLKKPGPSRLRRCARRAEAREAAEKAASKEPSTNRMTAEVAAQTENITKQTCDAAEQADLPAAAQADLLAAAQASHHHKAVQAGHVLPAVEAALCPPAVQAARHLPVLQGKQLPAAEQARPWLPHLQPVHDALCPDLQYGVAEFLPRHVSADIPQVDGNVEQTWSCKCCYYETFFDTEYNLKQHHDTDHDEWEECNWYYPYHVWIPQD